MNIIFIIIYYDKIQTSKKITYFYFEDTKQLDANEDGFVFLPELETFLEYLHVNNSINIATYLFDEAKSKGEFGYPVI
jgi:hypothetical protein